MGGNLAPGAEFEKKIIWSSGSPFIQRSGTICVILAKGIIRNHSVKLFEFGPVIQKKMLIKRHYLSKALTSPLFGEANHLCNCGRRHHEENLFCRIIDGLGLIRLFF